MSNRSHLERAPRLTGLQHVGIPVKDLGRSLQWYEEMLGLTPVVVAANEGVQLSRSLSVPEARIRYAFFDVGGSLLELLQYDHPPGRSYDRSNNDVGAVHVCFEVSDIDAMYKRLVAKGVRFSAPPYSIPSGGWRGCRFAYFTDPDGIQLELWEYSMSPSAPDS